MSCNVIKKSCTSLIGKRAQNLAIRSQQDWIEVTKRPWLSLSEEAIAAAVQYANPRVVNKIFAYYSDKLSENIQQQVFETGNKEKLDIWLAIKEISRPLSTWHLFRLTASY